MAKEVEDLQPLDINKMKPFAVRIEKLQAEIDAIKEAAADEAGPLYEEIAAVKNELVEAGFHKAPFGRFLKARKKVREINDLAKGLTENQVPEYEAMMQIGGMQLQLPLGDLTEKKQAA